jgi:stress-induced morphogen
MVEEELVPEVQHLAARRRCRLRRRRLPDAGYDVRFEITCLRRSRGHISSRKLALTAMATHKLEALLRQAFPGAAELGVEDRTGTGDHFQVVVTDGLFDGLTLVDQHRLVYAALAEPLADGTIHELRIRTKGTT